jgi:kinesin family member 2/24
LAPHTPSSNLNLCVCVRKRPIFKKEELNGECDSISCANPLIKVMAPKFKVDGISKFVEDSDFQFDNTFNENETTEEVFNFSLEPLTEFLVDQGGVVTCFAYG